jgi:ribosomal protein S18 acetylase RimI-like enzyme
MAAAAGRSTRSLAVMLSVASISVRKAEPSDYLALVGVDQYASSHFERGASINEALAKGECFTAESDGELLGYVVLNYTFFGFGFIPLIVVAQPHRRRGIGMRLLREARSQCTSRKLFTSANASNVAAQSVFRRAGFVRSGVIENLDAGDPDIVYFVDSERT